MPPSIRYATTDDGVRIAFSTLGEGSPLLCLPPFPFSHLDAGWRLSGQRRWYERLSRHAEVALFDSRGTGLSERGQADFSIEAMTRDLESVVRQLGWERFALCGLFNATPIALHYAAQHPEAVTDLVLWGSFTRGTDVFPVAVPADAPDLAALYWPVLVETAAKAWTDGGAEAKELAAFFHECVDARTAMATFAAVRAYDVEDEVSAVATRTLVLNRPAAPAPLPHLASALAARLPDARLALLEGETASPFTGDVDAIVDAVEGFLGVQGSPSALDAGRRIEAGAEELTPREAEVLRLLAGGLQNKEIARRLGVSIHTVERHLTNLYPKIGCRNRAEATAYALTHGHA